MKTLKFLGFMLSVLTILVACEELFDLGEDADPNTLDSLAAVLCPDCSDSLPDGYCPTCGDSTGTPGNPSDSGNTSPDPGGGDYYYPSEVGPNCDTLRGLWICGMDDSTYFNYDLLNGEWYLYHILTFRNDASEQQDDYFSKEDNNLLTFTSDQVFSETYKGNTTIGTWELYPEINNQIWLISGDTRFTGYIITLQYNDLLEVYELAIVAMDRNQIAIVEKRYRRN